MSDRFRLQYRTLSVEEQLLVKDIKNTAEQLGALLDRAYADTTDGTKRRYNSLAMTALEECVMWATKAVTT